MNKTVKSLLRKYLIAFFFGGLLAYFYVSQRDFAAAELMEKYRILCDAFTIPGMMMILIGLLIAVSNEGAFDGLLYAVTYAAKALIPFGRQNGHEKYADYVERKREKRVSGYGFMFISGAVFMVVAMVFLILFYRLRG